MVGLTNMTDWNQREAALEKKGAAITQARRHGSETVELVELVELVAGHNGRIQIRPCA
jgi:hypothetical protein